MTSPLAPPRPLRRLLSALLALTVLLTMLGWGHPSCEGGSARHEVTGPSGAHAGMAAVEHEAPSDDHTVPHAPQGCPEHDRHDEHGGAPCALVAHCAAGVLASTVGVPASPTLRVAPTDALTASRPLDAAYQPDSPPPKA